MRQISVVKWRVHGEQLQQRPTAGLDCLSLSGDCAGIDGVCGPSPVSVWESWQRHLGQPDLRRRKDGTYALAQRGDRRVPRTSIFVFEIDSEDADTPNAIHIDNVISASADAISHYALKVAADAAVERANEGGWLLARIQKRLASWWPELAGS